MVNRDFELLSFNTFGLSATADKFISLASEKEAIDLFSNHQINPESTIILGGGSNILFTKDFDGTIVHPLFNSIDQIARGEKSVFISAEAGVVWDDLVAWSVDKGFGGLENLSHIPGTVGAAPIQNIGAYGVEVCDLITIVRTVNLKDGSVREFKREECEFGYRSSIFKLKLKGEYLVTSIILELQKEPHSYNISYGDIEKRVAEFGDINIQNIRNAVISIREEKLPDPKIIGNAGSFFKNPVISQAEYNTLAKLNPGMPNWPLPDGRIKIPAAWLIEKTGWKGYRSGDAGVHHLQPLVLINHGKAKGSEILNLSKEIIKSVASKFSIDLEYEVNIL
jgi:UDP-N-acetylmuramate dehydrogenase